jgi:hypothetical protein
VLGQMASRLATAEDSREIPPVPSIFKAPHPTHRPVSIWTSSPSDTILLQMSLCSRLCVQAHRLARKLTSRNQQTGSKQTELDRLRETRPRLPAPLYSRPELESVSPTTPL